MKNKKMTLSEKDLHRIINESVNKVLNESFEEGSTIEDIVMKLYKLGVKLNTNKDYQTLNIRGIGSIIMESCKRIMELYKNEDLQSDFKTEYSKLTNKNGGV